jgi:SAM-dependent methyltransferases
VDYSRRSIDYAKRYAEENSLQIAYRYQNYLEVDDENPYAAVLLIYGDFCPLNPEQRRRLLRKVHRALKPGGKFVLDVSTRECRKKHGNRNHWRAMQSGFWKLGSHLVLQDGFDYPESSIWLDQYIVIEPNGKLSVYRNWFQDSTPETIGVELSVNSSCVESLWGDLTGQAYVPDGEWIGLITSKK